MDDSPVEIEDPCDLDASSFLYNPVSSLNANKPK